MPNQCGRSCEHCTVRAETHCGGCQYVIDHCGCEIAECVSKNNHASCETCIMRTNCPTKRLCGKMPELRAEKSRAAAKHQVELSKNSVALAKWLNLLFLSEIVSLIVSLFTGDASTQLIQGVFVPDIIAFVLDVVQVYFIWQLRDIHTDYRKASLYRLISAVLNVATNVVTEMLGSLSETAAAAVTLIISIPGTVISIYAVYLLCTAHSWVTADVDRELSEKWEKLWQWQLGLLIGTLCSPLLAFLGVIGALAMLVCLVGMIIVGILELVYLYSTVKLFRYYSEG